MLQLLAQTTIEFDLKDTATDPAIDLPYANQGLGNFISVILTGLIALGAILVLVYLIWGAFDWISSGNEKGKVESARNKITGALIGLFVLASILAIFSLMQQFLGIEVINFGGVPEIPPGVLI